MPAYIGLEAVINGVDSVPYFWPIVKSIPWLVALFLAKVFFGGASNTSERNLHGKVVLVTGGTSGIGEAVVRGLALRGAQILLLTQHDLTDPFLVDHIDSVRKETNNQLITAETVNLLSLHSIRQFATKWIDNAPPRRLDMIILCAATLTPSGGKVESTSEGVEVNWMMNYLANFHLLSILSPALRAQPPDRDVRIIFATCSSYMGGDLLHITNPAKASQNKKTKTSTNKATTTHSPTTFSPGNAYATSKYALTTFALAFQKHLSNYDRPDKQPVFPHVILADPGLCRTPGTRRWLTWGSLFGLSLYVLTYPFWWLVLKAPDMGAQSILYAAMEESFARGEGGSLIREVKERSFLREEVKDEAVQKALWNYSEEMVQEAEKRGAIKRTLAKKEAEDAKEEKEAAEELKRYKESVGKKDGVKKPNSRRSKKAA